MSKMDVDMLYELSDEWEELWSKAMEFKFDYGEFQALAIKTHRFLLPYDFEEIIPSILTRLLFQINNFAMCPCFISSECEGAKEVAQAFTDRIQYSWLVVDKNDFIVCIDGVEHNINTQTFDISEII